MQPRIGVQQPAGIMGGNWQQFQLRIKTFIIRVTCLILLWYHLQQD